MVRVCISVVAIVALAVAAGCGSDDTPPYQPEIRDWDDLRSVDYHLNKSFILMNDLDATTAGFEELAGESADGGMGWKPIGTSDKRFTGSFNGQGYEIRDVFVRRPEEGFVGLFGAVGEQGLVDNVGIVNANLSGEWAVGGLVGGNWGRVMNSCFSGTVSGDDSVGGLVGGNGGHVSNSHAIADVTGRWDVGGLVGGNDCSGTVEASHSAGTVIGEWAVGGLVGGSWGGAVYRSYSTSGVTGIDYVGGLVGDNQGIVSDSHSSGDVTGSWYVGGLVGYNDEGVVSKCYSAGSVTGDWHAGGLVGGNLGGSVSNSFWDNQASSMNESDGGVGKSTMEMRDISTFFDTTTEQLDQPWDIVAVSLAESDDAYIWNIVDGQTYPFLSWSSRQNPTA